MTDHTNELDRAERIARLQARRAAAGRSPRTESAAAATPHEAAAPVTPTTSAARPRAKRGHPAAATRWMLAGLSVASFFTIAGAVNVASQGSASAPQPATTGTAVTPVQPAATPAVSPTKVATVTRAPAPAPAPHTTTRGS